MQQIDADQSASICCISLIRVLSSLPIFKTFFRPFVLDF